MLFELESALHAELKCALMGSVKPAGGEHVPVSALGSRTGHLEGGEIAKFCTEIEKYCQDWPIHDPDNREWLVWFTSQLRSGHYLTVLIVDDDHKAVVMASPKACAFDEVIEARDEIPKAIAEFISMVEKHKVALAPDVQATA